MTLFAILAAVKPTRILFSTFLLAKRKSKLIGLGTDVEMNDYSFKRQNSELNESDGGNMEHNTC